MASVIQYVGDPFVDAGVAVLEHRIDKACADFTRDDLTQQANELEAIYSGKTWSGYLHVHFPNSCWCNANMAEAKRKIQRTALLRGFDREVIRGKMCVYCIRPAQFVGDRSSVPLVTASGTMNCGPGGEPGLPICAGCQFAIQFYPLAALKVGDPLFWWTPDHEWMYALTKDFVRRVEMLIAGSPGKIKSLPWPPSRLFQSIETVLEQTKLMGKTLAVSDLIGCHLTNYNSDPDYNELRIDKGLVAFVEFGLGHSAYRLIRDQAWETVSKKGKKGKKNEAIVEQPREFRRNLFYEDLGKYLYGSNVNHAAIVRRHFLPRAGKVEGLFEVAGMFSRRVAGMKQVQVAAVKELAQQIANSAKATDFLRFLIQSRGLNSYVRSLVNISIRMAKAGEKPIPTETVFQAFDVTSDEDIFDRSAGLVRELILLRIIELLPPDSIPETKPNEEEEE